MPAIAPHRPPIELLLDIDRRYLQAAAAGQLRKIAPRRFNPTHEAWLPIMHVDRDGWSFTAMFSNTELAHRLHRTDDWVVVYYQEPHTAEGQATVVTEYRGPLHGRRVVRGRERECAAVVDDEPEATRQAG
jgi:putative hydrolase